MKKKLHYDKGALPIPVYDEHPEWVDLYYTAWQMAFANIDYPGQPGWLPQMSCIPGLGVIWQWDSCFMSLFAKYSNNTLPAMNNLDNLYRLHAADGFQSMAYIIQTGLPAYGQRINPPLFAWVEWEYYLFSGDSSRFERIYPVLSEYYRWLKKNRTRESGLYWFEDTGSSGMDNSPRSAFPSASLNGSDVCWVDLISQQALSAFYLAKIFSFLKIDSEWEYFIKEYEGLCKLINRHHWSERQRFYYDVFDGINHSQKHKFLNTRTAAAFWPVLCGASSDSQINGLTEHLLNPDEFWTPHPVPTLSRDDSNYDPKGNYWCGGVWAPINYMVAAGLKRSNRFAIAKELTAKHLSCMVEVKRNITFDSIWECYSPEYPEPATKNEKGEIVRNNFVGWSGLGPIAMLIENILGFSFNAPDNTISWMIDSSCVHGLQNFYFNGKLISLLCEKANPSGQRKIIIETNGAFILSLNSSKQCDTTIQPGKHVFYI